MLAGAPAGAAEALATVERDLQFQARLKEYEAAALTGSCSELERARDYALAAAEALLGARYAQAITLLRSWGLDPAERPHR